MSLAALLLLVSSEKPPAIVMKPPPPEIQACIAQHRTNEAAFKTCVESHRDAGDTENPETMPLDTLERGINERHPLDYMMLAARLFFEAERKDDGLFWFYAWQLRQRVRLACHPDADPSGEPALFGALFVTHGPEFNEYAGADPDKWAAIVDRVLAWDTANPSQYEGDAACTTQRHEVRAGLEELARTIREHRDEILVGVEFDPS